MFFGLALLPLEVLAEAAIVIAAAEVLFYFVSKGVDRILEKRELNAQMPGAAEKRGDM